MFKKGSIMSDLLMREATYNDFDYYYKIKCDTKNVEWSGFQSSPDYDGLKKRFKSFFDDGKQRLLLFENNGNVIGYVNFFYTTDGEHIETSHGTLSDHNIKSLGFKMLKMAVQYIENSERYRDIQGIVGWVAENNIASLQNVIKNGYTPTGKTEFREIMGKSTKFVQYERKGVNNE